MAEEVLCIKDGSFQNISEKQIIVESERM